MSGFGPTIRQLGQSSFAGCITKTQRARQAQVGREGDMVNRKNDKGQLEKQKANYTRATGNW